MKTFYVIEKGIRPFYFQQMENEWPTWVLNINNCMQFDSEAVALLYKAQQDIDGEVIEHAYED